MSLRDEIIFDKNGFVPPANITQPESDNGVLYTSQYYLLLHERGELTTGDYVDFLIKMQSIVNTGNIRRRPEDNGQEGPDDYIGLCAASRALGSFHIDSIYLYGKSHWWIYNLPNPGKFTLEAWFGRQPGLIGFIKFCAGKRMLPHEILAIYVGTLITAFGKKEETSDKILALVMMGQLKDSILFKPLAAFYTWRLRNVYGSINSMIRIFFGPSHPFSHWWT